MKKFLLLLIFPLVMISCNTTSIVDKGVHALLITGGHSFDTLDFFDMFRLMKNISFDTISQPRANQLTESGKTDKYDVIVFYDMWKSISDDQKDAYIKLTEKGTGLVFLHHSLVSYQDWDEMTKIRGGKYYDQPTDLLPKSTFAHDIVLEIKVFDSNHPVTNGINDFTIVDEGYNNIEVLQDVKPLLGTNHKDCSESVAWTTKYNNSKVAYILLGHDKIAYQNASYRHLVNNAILWAD
jgi:type 1 glutamine amidotransferase